MFIFIGLCTSIIACLNHRSMFVTNAAVGLLSSILILPEQAEPVPAEHNPDSTTLSSRHSTKLNNMLDELWNTSQHNTRLLILQIIHAALVKCPDQGYDSLYEDCRVFDKVFTVLETCGDSASRNQAVQILTIIKR